MWYGKGDVALFQEMIRKVKKSLLAKATFLTHNLLKNSTQSLEEKNN